MTAPLKITFVLPTVNMSGGIRVVAIYADQLRQRGHQVTLVSVPARVPTFRSRLSSLLRWRGWPRKAPPVPSHLDGMTVRHHVIDRFRPIEDRDLPDADVVVATWWETAEWVARLSPLKGAKAYFVQHHETIFDGQPTARAQATYRLPMHKITISRWLVELMRDQYGDDDVTHVPNSVDAGQFFAQPRGKQPVPTVGMLYTSISWKGVDVALRALDVVRTELPDVRLISFGTEPVTSGLPLPPGTRFELAPAQEHLRELYAECDVWLCASRAEGFHLPPLEAMACRTPVVSTRVGGPMDVIDDGVNGRLVEVGDHQALGDALLEVLQSAEAVWTAMSDAALATATRYTWADATEGFESGLRVAIDKQKRRSRSLASSATRANPPGAVVGT